LKSGTLPCTHDKNRGEDNAGTAKIEKYAARGNGEKSWRLHKSLKKGGWGEKNKKQKMGGGNTKGINILRKRVLQGERKKCEKGGGRGAGKTDWRKGLSTEYDPPLVSSKGGGPGGTTAMR